MNWMIDAAATRFGRTARGIDDATIREYKRQMARGLSFALKNPLIRI